MHIKRIVTPKSWKLDKKETKWTARPMPGPHALKQCITINLLLKNLLKYAQTTKEVKEILTNGKIVVDKSVRKDYKFPVGIFDVVEIADLNEHYRVVYDKSGYFVLLAIKKDESNIKPCKIIGKNFVKGKKMQLNFSDGRNKIVDKNEYGVGDTVVIDLTKKDIKEYFKLEKGSFVYITDGKYKGYNGVIQEIIESDAFRKARVIFTSDGNKIETLKQYAFVLGKGKPAIKVQ